MIKVAHVAPSMASEWGGPTTVIRELTEYQTRMGCNVVIFAPTKKGANHLSNPRGVELKLAPDGKLSSIWTSYSPLLKKKMNKELEKADIVHIHGLWHYPQYVAYQICKKNCIPYIVTPHGCLEPWALKQKRLKKLLFSIIQRRILQEASLLHAITRKEVEAIKNFGINNSTVVIPNGIDISEYQQLPEKAAFRNLYPELIDKQIILFLGRIHPKKGLELLASAFGQIARTHKNARLVIAGPDTRGYQAKIEHKLKVKKVLNKTIFTGILTGKMKQMALSSADIFVLPSYLEHRSIAVLEALACKLPVVITYSCQFPEVAKINAGRVISTNDNQLRIAIMELLNNRQLRKKMGERGSKLVKQKYSWDKIANKIVRLYQKLIDQFCNNC